MLITTFSIFPNRTVDYVKGRAAPSMYDVLFSAFILCPKKQQAKGRTRHQTDPPKFMRLLLKATYQIELFSVLAITSFC